MSVPIPQILAGAAFSLWSQALEHPETGILISCVSLDQGYKVRKNLYAVRSRERKTNQGTDTFGNPTGGTSAWDNMSTVMCFNVESAEYQAHMAQEPPTIPPKAAIMLWPVFLWVGPATIQMSGLEVFHPISGQSLSNWTHIPKLPPRVVDNKEEKA